MARDTTIEQQLETMLHAAGVANSGLVAELVIDFFTDPDGCELADMEPLSVGLVGNYYGTLLVKVEDSVPYWSITDWDGDTWEPCPMRVFMVLKSVFIDNLIGEGEEE